MAGTLFVVATPIGNLEDVTFRALRILKEAAAIACEDTRRTALLLARYEIKNRLISHYQPREGARIPMLIGLLKEGKDVALVSDAGTPAISDPGFRLVREAVREGLRVVPIPGPSAVTTALCAAGLPTHRFLFAGFPPPKSEGLRKALVALAEQDATLIFYLPGRKIEAFLEAVQKTLGDRPVVIARELTKIYEEFLRGSASELATQTKGRVFKGELTVLVGGKTRE
ncbi:MAG: 16S rRNA (cytidine(1402)-2'-O)-methyltransferase [Candidatus Aminicenantes bacterium]|nr:16S rRNA (cytidine(1402)-2'-O)-methyltransferase [Candidatus Aminicenantes bacterium]